jgi:hypothetical protein
MMHNLFTLLFGITISKKRFEEAVFLLAMKDCPEKYQDSSCPKEFNGGYCDKCWEKYLKD